MIEERQSLEQKRQCLRIYAEKFFVRKEQGTYISWTYERHIVKESVNKLGRMSNETILFD